MNRNDKAVLEQRGAIKYQYLRVKEGIHKVAHQKESRKTVIMYIFTAIAIWILLNIFVLPEPNHPLKVYFQFIIGSLYLIAAAFGLLTCLMLIGTPKGAYEINENLYRCGLINSAGESPLLLRRYTIPGEMETTVLELDMNGIQFPKWQDGQESIETTLDVYVTKMKLGENKRRILLYTVAGDAGLPEVIYWKDEYLSEKDFELVLGYSFGERIKIDLTKVPHLLIGGSTGSGKSILLKCLLMQCVKKDAEVIISDFKGGVDFSPIWHEKCTFITEETELLDTLTNILHELKHRKFLLKDCGCANISEFNQRFNNHFKRIIFACDEVAELLDKTGLSKEQKELISKIEQCLSTIARQGRAFGIHLMLATQRPDANILSGQIKNNLDYRICGRADNVLSMIILDNADANDKIPKDSQGLFLNHEGTVFRGYLFDEETAFSEQKE
ncbi:FtsK/SpoIIIE domain-containing protein [Anaerotignum sp.]